MLNSIVVALTLCVELGLIGWGYLRGGTAPLATTGGAILMQATTNAATAARHLIVDGQAGH